MKNKLVIILLGPPGSGKGTQAKLLAKKFKLEYLGSGNILRQRRKKGNFTGKRLKEVMRRGELVPSFVISRLLTDKLEELKNRPRLNGFILDGWTRILVEAELIDESLDWYEWQKNVKIILINISDKESFDRLTKRKNCKDCGRFIPWIGEFKKLKRCDKCGGLLISRADDKPKAIKKRLEEFKEETKPVIDYYKKQGRLIKINGEQSIENVFKDILKTLKK